jgi:hypothetical protein
MLAFSTLSANAHSVREGRLQFIAVSLDVVGTITVPDPGGIDVVWKDTVCSNGYGSPPVAFTWSGTSTGVTSNPLMGPCGHAPGSSKIKGPDDLRCDFSLSPPYINCYWTWKSSTGTATTSLKIANPGGGTLGSVYLYKRTALYAYLITPGHPNKKISVPAGGVTIQFTTA